MNISIDFVENLFDIEHFVTAPYVLFAANGTYLLRADNSFSFSSQKIDNFSILVFSYGSNTRTNLQLPYNVREKCEIPFDCFIHSNSNKGLPYGSIVNFSAILAFGK